MKPSFGPIKVDFFIIGLNLTGYKNLEINHLAFSRMGADDLDSKVWWDK
jgi:hypothetical protein